MTVLEQIAALATESVSGPVDADVRAASRRCLIDWLGVAIAGWNEPAVRQVCAAFDIAHEGGLGAAFAASVPADHAALALGTASHALDYDDTDYVNLIHVSSTLLPALFGLSRELRVGGTALLDVFNAAYEAEDRIGAELGRKLTACGWHVSGVIGRFGSALGCGLALRLPAPALANAMAIASTSSSGLIGAFGTMSKPFQLARGAADGVVAAELARHGFTGPVNVLESEPGFGLPFVHESIRDWSSIARDWGRPYAVLRNAFKPHASCMITHPIVDAAMALGLEIDRRADGVAKVECRVNPLAPHVAGYTHPSTGLQGKFSVAYCCIAGLLLGHATPSAFALDTLSRADVQALLPKVEVVTDAAVGEQGAVVTIYMNDGRTLLHEIRMAKGNPANPLSDDELDSKFLLLAEPVLGRRAHELVTQLHTVERIDDVGAWLRACVA